MTDQAPNDTQTIALVQTLATADPDFDAFARRHPGLDGPDLSAAQQAALGRDLLAVLRASPEHGPQVNALLKAPPPPRYDGGVGTASLLVAVAFLLRSHIKLKRDADGRWTFQYEHKPADNRLLSDLLTRLAALLPGGEGKP